MAKLEDHTAADIAKSIPRDYLDGCTLFPDRFGQVSHKHICIQHDIDYWTKRTAIGKIVSDWWWLVGINTTHRSNLLQWKMVVLFSSVLGWLALSTFGWFFWFGRSRWDKINNME